MDMMGGLAKVFSPAAAGFRHGEAKALARFNEEQDQAEKDGINEAKAARVEAFLKNHSPDEINGHVLDAMKPIDYGNDAEPAPVDAAPDSSAPAAAPSAGIPAGGGGLAPEANLDSPLMGTSRKFTDLHQALSKAASIAPKEGSPARKRYLSGLYDLYNKDMDETGPAIQKEYLAAKQARDLEMARHGLGLLVGDGGPDAVAKFYEKNGQGKEMAFMKGGKVEGGKVYLANGRVIDMTSFLANSKLLPNLTDNQILQASQKAMDTSSKLDAQKIKADAIADEKRLERESKERIAAGHDQAGIARAGISAGARMATSLVPRITELASLQAKGQLTPDGTRELQTLQVTLRNRSDYHLDGSENQDAAAKSLLDGKTRVLDQINDAMKAGQTANLPALNAQVQAYEDRLNNLRDAAPASPYRAPIAAAPGGLVRPKPGAAPTVAPVQSPVPAAPGAGKGKHKAAGI